MATKVIRDRNESELNQHILKTRTQWVTGVLDACNLLNQYYGKTSSHPYLIGDCVLAKLNLLARGKKLRKTPREVKILERKEDYT